MPDKTPDILPNLFESAALGPTDSIAEILSNKNDKFFSIFLEQTDFYPKSLFIIAHSGTTFQILSSQLKKKVATTHLIYEHDTTTFKEINHAKYVIRIELNTANIAALLQIILPERKMSVFLNNYAEEMEKYINDHQQEYVQTLMNYLDSSSISTGENKEQLLQKLADQKASCGWLIHHQSIDQITTYAAYQAVLAQFTSVYIVIDNKDMLAFTSLLKDAEMVQRLPDGKAIVTFHFGHGSDFHRLLQMRKSQHSEEDNATLKNTPFYKQIVSNMLLLDQLKEKYHKYSLKLLTDFFRREFTGVKDKNLYIVLTLCERFAKDYGIQQPLIICRSYAERVVSNSEPFLQSSSTTGHAKSTEPPVRNEESPHSRQSATKKSFNYLLADQLSLGQVQERLIKLFGDFKPAIDISAELLLENMGFFSHDDHHINYFSKDHVCSAWEYDITLFEANEELIQLYREKRGKNIDTAHGVVCISLPNLALMYVLHFIDTVDNNDSQYTLAVETAANLIKRYSLTIPKAYHELFFAKDYFSELEKWQATESYKEQFQDQLNLKAAFDAHHQASLLKNSLFTPPRDKIPEVANPDTDNNPPPFSGLVVAKKFKGSGGTRR